MPRKERGIPTKLPISKLLISLELQTSCLIQVYAYQINLVGRYKNYLICIRSILIKTLKKKNRKKCLQIDSSVPTTLLISQLL